MNYQLHYDRLIGRARGRTLDGHRDQHHVLPKCMGGGNGPENLVELTSEEHYVAHQLLVKMYTKNRRLAYAMCLMAKRASGNKAYGWLRRRIAESMRGNTYAFLLRGRKNGPLSPEHRAKLSANIRTPEWRENIGAAGRGKKKAPRTAEHCRNLGLALRGKKHSTEVIAKNSAAQRRSKAAIKHRQRLHSMNRGRVHTPEAREHMAASRRGKKRAPFTAGHRKNLSLANLARYASRKEIL